MSHEAIVRAHMRPIDRHSPTIGFLSTWSVYEGTTIDNYTRTLLQGICAAARDHHCHLLSGCGIGLPATPRGSRTAWATPGPTADFVPVGPWNTDGLIIIPDDCTDAQFKYVQDVPPLGISSCAQATHRVWPAPCAGEQ